MKKRLSQKSNLNQIRVAEKLSSINIICVNLFNLCYLCSNI